MQHLRFLLVIGAVFTLFWVDVLLVGRYRASA